MTRVWIWMLLFGSAIAGLLTFSAAAVADDDEAAHEFVWEYPILIRPGERMNDTTWGDRRSVEYGVYLDRGQVCALSLTRAGPPEALGVSVRSPTAVESLCQTFSEARSHVRIQYQAEQPGIHFITVRGLSPGVGPGTSPLEIRARLRVSRPIQKYSLPWVDGAGRIDLMLMPGDRVQLRRLGSAGQRAAVEPATPESVLLDPLGDVVRERGGGIGRWRVARAGVHSLDVRLSGGIASPFDAVVVNRRTRRPRRIRSGRGWRGGLGEFRAGARCTARCAHLEIVGGRLAGSAVNVTDAPGGSVDVQIGSAPPISPPPDWLASQRVEYLSAAVMYAAYSRDSGYSAIPAECTLPVGGTSVGGSYRLLRRALNPPRHPEFDSRAYEVLEDHAVRLDTDGGDVEAQLVQVLPLEEGGAGFTIDGPATAFGVSIAADGTVVVVGCPARGGGEPASGVAMVFAGSDDTIGVVLQAPVPDAPEFGAAVAVANDGGAVAIADTGNQMVSVFERRATGWERSAVFHAPDAGSPDGFGAAIAMTTDMIVIGSPRWRRVRAGVGRTGGDEFGNAYVARRGAEGAWSELVTVLPAATQLPSLQSGFGSSVALDGDRMFVGAPRDLVSSARAGEPDQGLDLRADGSVYVFDVSGTAVFGAGRVTSNLRVVEPLEIVGASGPLGFGSALAVERGSLLVGVPGQYEGAGGVDVYVFERYQPLLAQRFGPEFAEAGSALGAALASGDGRVAVGLPGATQDGVPGAGAVLLLETIPGGGWSWTRELREATPQSWRGFGGGMGLAHGRVYVGPSRAQGVRGYVDVFEVR